MSTVASNDQPLTNLAIDSRAFGDSRTLLVASAIFGSIIVFPGAASGVMAVCLAAGLLVASWIDTRTRLIPNRLTYPLILVGITCNLVASLFVSERAIGIVGIGESLTGAVLCFGVMLLLFMSNATGGGDVKLATAIGAFLGPQAGLTAIAWCHICAGVFIVLWLLCRLPVSRMICGVWAYSKSCLVCGSLQPVAWDFGSVSNQRIPMAAFFALGTFLTQLGWRLW